MKDQYFGDLGDYQKFSLLKLLRDCGGLKIVVHWMKTKNDKTSNGNRTNYLAQATTWRKFDPEVFDFLKQHWARKTVSVFQNSRQAQGLVFIDNLIDQPQGRENSFKRLQPQSEADLIFFDPDNGIEVKSTSPSNQQKYILWADLRKVFVAGKSLLIYQHFPRQNRSEYIGERLTEIRNQLSIQAGALQVQHSVYFVLPQPPHLTAIQKSFKAYAAKWGELANIIKM